MSSLDTPKTTPRGVKETMGKSRISIEERVVTSEQKKLYRELIEKTEEIRHELARILPDPVHHRHEPLPPEIRNALLGVALHAREFAVHYGNYKVGAVLVGVRTPTVGDSNPWTIMFDANTKETTEHIKHCAEQHLMDRAENALKNGDFDEARAFLVVAAPRDIPGDPLGFMDDISKKKQMTLTPCAMCRERMTRMSQEEKSIISPDFTEVITANSASENLWVQKLQKVKDLAPFHGEPLPRNVMEIDEND